MTSPESLLDTLQFTPATEEDLPFIFASWLNSYRLSSDTAGIKNSTYFSKQHQKIERTIEKAHLLVARGISDPDWICGWLCSDQVTVKPKGADDGKPVYVLHYVYVKPGYRGERVLTTMMSRDLEARGLTGEHAIYTHRRPPFSNTFERWGMTFVPM